MEFSNDLLRRYRDDRRKLLEFLLSSDLIKEITTPADIEFDHLSADYVLECIQSGGVLDVSQATRRYRDESSHPIAMHLQSGDVFYLLSGTESAGSPPRRVAPSIPLNRKANESDFVERNNFPGPNYPAAERSHISSQEAGINYQENTIPCAKSLDNKLTHSVGLPNLRTGLWDDDLRETAYEVFLACMLFSGLEIQTTEGRKREKSSKFLSGLKNRKEKRHIESAPIESHLKVLDTIRLQMQISEAADAFIRRRLTQFVMGKVCAQIDVPQLSLVLLTGLLRSDFPSEKSYLHWKSRQVNIFEELVRSDHMKTEKEMIEESLEKIKNSKEWDIKMSSSQRRDALLTLRQVALAFSSIPGRFGIEGETYYWTSGYHLNIRLYEKLLFGLFDVLEESQIIEEAEEILKLVKLTWSMLGITERLHHTLFAWVLFQQVHRLFWVTLTHLIKTFTSVQFPNENLFHLKFVTTEEAILLDHAIREVKHVLSADIKDDKEVSYMRSLTCPTVGIECETRFDLLQSIFFSISLWCDSKLQDYHLYFSQNSSFFERVLTMGLSTGTQDFIPHRNTQFTGYFLPNDVVTQKIRVYIEKTQYAACRRAIDFATGSMNGKRHPLAILASELKQIAEKDLSIFSPILRRWYPECAMISAKMLHQLYGETLKPFMKDITSITEDVRKVLPAAYGLECCLIELYSSACEENNSHYSRGFERYQIAEISKPFILDWVVAQYERILEWTGRAFDLEDWEPLSAQQKHAASAVEVFRIIEETVDQFFQWSLPMDITHLQALLSIIFHSLDTYLSKVISQLVEKQKLYPSTPPLTRYKEATFPIIKRKVAESSIIDHEIYKELDELTSSKLCIRLNTYRYIQKQVAILEEGIRKSWESVASNRKDRYSTERTPATLEPTDVNGESVSEIFVATMDCIRDSAAQGIQKTSEFLGAKVVFWDMRDSFLSYLYYGGVEGNRIEAVLPQFDKVLNDVCSVVDDTIRDLVVSNIWKASLEGFMWVLLDGGPSRAFSDSDTVLIEEDFNMLKELFIADGEGLPRSLVEEEAKFYRQVLSLFSLQTESLIKMLISSSQNMSAGVNRYKKGQRYVGDTHTLLRVLCHKKDKEASKFLKKHYRFPASSEYDETAVESSSFGSPFVADILKRGASFSWSEKSHSSFRSITKKFQQVSWK
ncbi:protein unc-13 homolog isoform X3 [Salvia splendens]|uniref:protein unc-13 homolog isoform X3 n=2 Tax=Salvia splendens TaxID=180675 RepID=UPI001C2603BA|nr:protein unc-13 homolog isoform X3 [Salvia splendens]